MIEKEQILLLTQGGLNVFSHFLGFEVNLHRNFRSPFYDDRRASCHIYYTEKLLLTNSMIMAIPPIQGIASGLWQPSVT